MITGIIVFFGLSLLILGHEAGHFFVAKWFKLKIEEFGFGFPPRIFARKRGEIEYSLNWLPFGGFVRIAGENDKLEGPDYAPKEKADVRRLFSSQPAWKRSLILLAGIAVNFVIGWFLISSILMVGTPKVLLTSNVQPGSPAEAAGIKRGDILAGFDGSDRFISFVNTHRGKETVFLIRRGSEELRLTATPRAETKPGEGALGVSLAEAGIERQPILDALGSGFSESLWIMKITLLSFFDLVSGLFRRGELLPGVVGPVGIFAVANEAGKIGFIYLIQLVAMISLNLAAINLLPFPALDGGRFFMVVIEAIKGSPLSKRVEMFANSLGFLFLLAVIGLITIRDITQLF